ncbi:23S rRNA (pseudouridine(1915)-N(3))-methyltransferase RlmH [Aurantimonas sp. VKM B-3413]|uniref:23S rRNA (pseudouridine(1915)-N(3))-methyltransferase RlmH n=1 Tax=Aurantimonas sp. VKM B-3413 TaxID=2779401 RepID=UPI001E45DB4E|nr:23S rRNA (pseudouridine(1915)-N(3))-methyltransferase RlmH [Aurantimonas sp. VKM B-3413]MCB8836658.1 23S rRNA (pseudouridine(1915)-N(3))-methyltransferase RlmH [Aurantimonas sp. VKM B-3413]
MRLAVAAVGRMKAGPERELSERYFDRLKKAGPAVAFEFQSLAEYPESRLGSVTERRRDEAERLGAAIPEGAVRVVLDETGKTLTSEDFAEALAKFRDTGRRDLVFLIGGPDGHDPSLTSSADLVLSLGRMTFPHQIARILLAEQIYRSATILAGHPYHRS